MKTIRKFAERLTCPRINVSHTHWEVINLSPGKKKKKKNAYQQLKPAQLLRTLKQMH